MLDVIGFDVVKMNQEHIEYLKKGFENFCNRNFTTAIEFYDKSLRIDPFDIVTMYDKALSLQYLKKDKEAIQIYDDIIRLDPDVFPLFYVKLKELDYSLQISGWKSLHLPLMGRVDLSNILLKKIHSLNRLRKNKEVEECIEMIQEWKIRQSKIINSLKMD